jgi:aminopeptidase
MNPDSHRPGLSPSGWPAELPARLARLIVTYSLDVRPGQRVQLLGPELGETLLAALAEEVRRAGAAGVVHIDPIAGPAGGASAGQDWPDPDELDATDACVFVEADLPAQVEPTLARPWRDDPQRLVDHFLRRGADQSLKWVVVQYPCEADAERAGLSSEEWTRLVASACFLDRPDPAAAWREQSAHQQALCDRLGATGTLRFTTPGGTDLTVPVAGRPWVNSDGHWNLPDGEVFTSPHEDGTQGVLVVEGPAALGDWAVEGLRLRFERGRVVEAAAREGQELLDRLLDLDDGARRVGEIAFGCNPALTRLTHHTLLDEKVGGTFHLALGAAYPQAGGSIRSLLHWDLVCDLRGGGRVEADGTVLSGFQASLGPDARD